MERRTKMFYAVKVIQKKVTKLDCLNIKQLTSPEKKNIGHLLKLDHQNVAKLKEVFETSFSLHIVVEFANGEELFRRLTKMPVYNEKTVGYYFRQVVDGIRYLHEYGIIHKNVKPENILLNTRDSDAIVKITDYSPQLFTTSDLDLEMVCLTTTFCAPELLLSRCYDKAIDLWALGILLYIMLCGDDPYKSKSGSDLYRAILHCDIEFESPSWKSISLDAQDVVKRLLLVDPKLRIITPHLLNHPWFIMLDENEKHLDSVQEKLEHFNKQRSEKYFDIEYEQDWITCEYMKLPQRSTETVLPKVYDENVEAETVIDKDCDDIVLIEDTTENVQPVSQNDISIDSNEANELIDTTSDQFIASSLKNLLHEYHLLNDQNSILNEQDLHGINQENQVLNGENEPFDVTMMNSNDNEHICSESDFIV
uniref:Calcium/calmodulin-dependent protein kinase type IV n=1 Tax=Schistosoma haematobium TaxID=6185 RepID=A0A094ZRP8_SCHHA